MILHYSTPWTSLQIAEWDQRHRFVPIVNQAICDSQLPFPGLPSKSSVPRGATIQVSSNDFSKGRAWLVVGMVPLTLVAGVDFKIGGTASQVATNLAAALKASGVQATASGANVMLVIPNNDQPFPIIARSLGVQNFNVLPEGGYPLAGPYDPPERVTV